MAPGTTLLIFKQSHPGFFMLKLVVFDCDGVMFDSKNLNRHYYNYLLAHFGYPDMNSAELDHVHTHNVAESVAYIFRNHPEQSLETVHQFRLSLNYSNFLHHMTMEEDLVYFLKSIQERYHLAISTNRSDTMEMILETFGLTHYFGKVVTATSAKRPKPEPDGMLEILEHFSCSPSEAIYIGDSIIDQMHAQSSGVPLIAFRNSALQAEFHVNSFSEILALAPFS